MKLIKTIKKVKNFLLINCDYLSFISIENKLYIYNNNFNTVNISLPEITRSIFSLKNELWFSDSINLKTIIIKFSNLESQKVDFMATLPNDINNFIIKNEIFPIVFINNNRYRARINFNDRNIINLFPLNYGINGIFKVLENETFLSMKEDILACHYLENGSELWRIDVSEIGAYKDISEHRSGSIDYDIFTYNNLVIFSSGPHVFAANYHTGKMVWHTTLRYNQARKVLFNNVIYIKSGLNFYQLDAATGKVLVEFEFQDKWLQSHDVGHWLSWHNIYEDCMAVTDCMTHKIVIVNKDNFDIMEIVDIKGAKNEIPIDNIPQIHGNRLYQLDGDNTLHVFEKE